MIIISIRVVYANCFIKIDFRMGNNNLCPVLAAVSVFGAIVLDVCTACRAQASSLNIHSCGSGTDL